jgi:hypothetical protein
MTHSLWHMTYFQLPTTLFDPGTLVKQCLEIINIILAIRDIPHAPKFGDA